LINPTTAIAMMATMACHQTADIPPTGGINWLKYVANAAARVAMDPVRTTQNSAQLNRNPESGPKPRFKYS
jgi:hypothetical protein